MSRFPPRQILVALDGSPYTRAVNGAAIALARCFGASLTALHVAQPRPWVSIITDFHAAAQAEEAARCFGKAVLREAREMAEGVPSFASELRFGDPADVICSRAQALGVDLIVLGSRGLGAVDRLMQGSVSSAVVQRARCSVLIVRSDDDPSSRAPGAREPAHPARPEDG